MSTILKVAAGGVIIAAALVAPSAAVAAPAAPNGKPAGCGTAHFCSYRSGNGGNICYNTTATYIASWSMTCRTVDSVFNNGSVAAMNLYYGTSATGAWYCLGNGNYLLYMTGNYFNNGSGRSGYGQPMANHVKSSRAAGSC